MSDYHTLFDRLMSEVDKVNQAATVSSEDAPEVAGTSYHDRITVHLRAGKVTGIQIHPIAMRLNHLDLADQLKTAVNAALEANLVTVMSGGHGIDLHEMNAALHDIQVESVALMDRYTDQMMGVLTRAKQL